MKFRTLWTAALAVAVAGVLSCGSENGPGPSPMPPPPTRSNVLVGAGDIAVCGSQGAAATAALLDQIDGIVFTAGDNAYFHGSAENYRDCYEPTWGRHKDRTRPAPGNHEYETAGAAAYFAYFGDRAGPPGRGYYSFNIGTWHIISLNSNVAAGEGSPQLQWLREDLAANPAHCTAAIWHHPLFSSGPNGPSSVMRTVYGVLRQARVEFVINGHEHFYERFERLTELGQPAGDGLRQFIAGTGGADLYRFERRAPGSLVQIAAHGVLKMTLLPDRFTWEFVTAPIGAVSDTDTGFCQ